MMIQATTLVELLNANRHAERHITYIEGEGVERRLDAIVDTLLILIWVVFGQVTG